MKFQFICVCICVFVCVSYVCVCVCVYVCVKRAFLLEYAAVSLLTSVYTYMYVVHVCLPTLVICSAHT